MRHVQVVISVVTDSIHAQRVVWPVLAVQSTVIEGVATPVRVSTQQSVSSFNAGQQHCVMKQ